MKIIEAKNYDHMSHIAANIIASQLILCPKTVLGLATGSSPEGIYKELVEKYNNGDIDFSQVVSFNLDEYCGLPREHEQSYYYYQNNHLFSKVNISKENTHLPNGNVDDINAECENYEKMIAESGGVDIQILGIGHTGHIGFNEPSDSFAKMTHSVDLEQVTIEANARFFNSIDEVPKKAVTMGIGTIMRAKKLVMVVSGKDKAEILYKSVTGEVTPKVPATILQFHKDVTIVADADAISILKEKAPHMISK